MKTILILLAFAQAAAGFTENEASDFFEKGEYQQALSYYSEASSQPGETGLRALYRAAECEALLMRYGEAAKRLDGIKLPKDGLWRARLLLLRAETGREFLKQYAYSLPTDSQEGTKDPEKLTAAQWRSRIGADYDALWELRGALVKRHLKDEGYCVDIAKASLEYTPTLWDFIVGRWSGYLTEEAGGGSDPVPAGKIAADKYKGDFSFLLPPAHKAAAILENAASLPVKDRETAAGLWRIKRLLLPVRSSGLFSGLDHAKAAAGAVEVLIKWKDTLPSALARAQAAYEAALISANNSRNKQAVDLCTAALELAPKSRPASECEKIKSRIELPSLQLSAKPVPPPGKGLASVTARNIPAVYFRLYTTSPGELELLFRKGENGFNSLRSLTQGEVTEFLSRKPELSWTTELDYPAPYQFMTKEILPPPLKKGLYVLAASGDADFRAGGSILKAAVVNVTDIFLLGTVGIKGDPEEFIFTPGEAALTRQAQPEMFHFYAVNALSGLPLGDAALDVFHGQAYSSGMQRARLRADGDGRAAVSEPVRLAYGNYQHFQADPLLSHGGAYALWNGPQSSGFSVPPPIEIKVESDRPIYRPGQKVSIKATVLTRAPSGYRVYSGAAKLKVTARDANWQEFYSKEFPVSSMGSVSGSFVIPAGRMLGGYQLTAELREYDANFSGEQRFQVEEYKRPEFEVTLKEASDAFRYGRKVRVEGAVKYYFGSPVPDAEVKYRVTRARFVPWYAWWWNWFYTPSGSSEVASGTARTDADGKFFVEFTPQAEAGSYAQYPASFNVEAEARDAGGRTITDSRSYCAGAKAYNFDITPDAGFFTSDKNAGFRARLMNLNGVQMSGGGSYSVHRLEKAPDFALSAGWGGRFGDNPSLEQTFGAVPDGEKVESGSLDFSAAKPSGIKLKPLPGGVYRLRLNAKDPWGGESESAIILVSADPGGKNPSLKLPPVAIFERASYQPGETARVLVGAYPLKGVKYAEILAGNFMLSKQTLRGGGVSMLSLKVEAAHRGGFAVRWFGAGDFNIYSAMGKASVPRTDRELKVTLPHPEALKPGARVNWTLKASDKAGKPVNGEGTVRIFDRSLEYYVSGAGSWLAGLYPERVSNSGGVGSLFNSHFTDIPVKEGIVDRMYSLFNRELEEEKLPSLRINSSRSGPRRFFGRGMAQTLGAGYEEESFSGDMAEMKSGGANLAASAPAAVFKGRAKSDRFDGEAVLSKDKKAGGPPVAVRKDFSETAYFNPQLKITAGKGPFSLRLPERLTSWKIDAAVITRDVKKGTISSAVVTRKELMARLDIPRFFREGDRSEITAVLSSQAQGELSGEVTLQITLDGGDAAEKFALAGPVKSFTLKPGGSAALRWPVTAPRGIAAYKVRVIARAAQLSDAQENDLPVLPSRERLIASQVAALDGKGTKELRLEELEKADKTRELESLHLEVQPQLILTVLNSLPFLVHYPHECTEQLLNRYVPLAITNSFYKKYPALAAAVKKIPKRKTLTPAWERDNPVRMMTLLETPWENLSKGRESSLPVVDMLDPKLVRAEKEDAITKLAGYQNSDGSFPWFPGGHSDLYMTLYMLDGLAEASRYGVEIPRETAKKALAYVLSEIPAHMKPDAGNVSFILYAAYVVTSFPADWPEHRTALSYARKWAQYADKQSGAMTAFGKAYAAYVWLRLGDKKLAGSYLDRAMDGAREDSISGVYWAPEKISWLWYNDTVEKHAFILRTLLAVRPADPRISGMVKWLLFSRKASEWKSTKATAAAIYSLLEVMKKKGALDVPEKISVSWGDVADSRTLQPFDWVGSPLRWSKYGADAGKAPVSAKVSKDGPGLSYASLSAIYTTDKLAGESPDGMMNVSRTYFNRVKRGDSYTLKPLSSGDTVSVGDELEVHLSVSTRGQFEYVHLKDPRGAGFEGTGLLSGWKWDQLSRYEEPRDSLTNFFMSRVPHGEYVLKYRVRPTTPGAYRIGSAVLQSMYAPEFAAHSAGMELNVK